MPYWVTDLEFIDLVGFWMPLSWWYWISVTHASSICSSSSFPETVSQLRLTYESEEGETSGLCNKNGNHFIPGVCWVFQLLVQPVLDIGVKLVCRDHQELSALCSLLSLKCSGYLVGLPCMQKEHKERILDSLQGMTLLCTSICMCLGEQWLNWWGYQRRISRNCVATSVSCMFSF